MNVNLIRIVITDKNTVKWFFLSLRRLKRGMSSVLTFSLFKFKRFAKALSVHGEKQCALVPQNPDKVIKMQTANIDYLKNYQHMNRI